MEKKKLIFLLVLDIITLIIMIYCTFLNYHNIKRLRTEIEKSKIIIGNSKR